MNTKCGSCGLVHDANKAECPNCQFPNRMFEEPDLSPIEINVEVGTARAMEERAKSHNQSVSFVWQSAAEEYLTNLVTKDLNKRRKKA